MQEHEIYELFKKFLAFSEMQNSQIQLKNNDDDYISVNTYIFDNQNKHTFFSYFNKIKSVDTIHSYLYPKNHGECWNCSRNYDHTCCDACKREIKDCTCTFICGLTFPIGRKNSNDEYVQFDLCKWFTSGNDFNHRCRGMVNTQEELILYSKKQDLKKNNEIRNKKVCFRCGADDHIVYNCKQKKKCYRCKRSDHLAHKDTLFKNYNIMKIDSEKSLLLLLKCAKYVFENTYLSTIKEEEE
ncbi:13135_t:CDS:2 [Cetraspora pellucida]|uniref:13135_t:CDS:1 n=1 Tax=Cetraspora pellucida TaxID=1433469 RepID=A0A9N9KA02_9GLOM|nr:13135_t:CDS:2 [Cetraspora pellucida]